MFRKMSRDIAYVAFGPGWNKSDHRSASKDGAYPIASDIITVMSTL